MRTQAFRKRELFQLITFGSKIEMKMPKEKKENGERSSNQEEGFRKTKTTHYKTSIIKAI